MQQRRGPDCGVTMQDVELVTTGNHRTQVKTGEAREGWLGKLGIDERTDVETMACPQCGRLLQYVDPDF